MLHISDYTYIDSNFKVRFPKFRPNFLLPPTKKPNLLVPEDLRRIIDGMTRVEPMKRMTCREAIKILD